MFSLGPDNQSIAANRVVDTIAGGYTQIPQKFYHPNASRNALGLVGGNEVSVASGNLVDIESDLRGVTRDLSNVPSRKYQAQPLCVVGEPVCASKQIVFTERSTGKSRTVATAARHLPTTQYASYPGVPAPEPLVQDVFGYPWRF